MVLKFVHYLYSYLLFNTQYYMFKIFRTTSLFITLTYSHRFTASMLILIQHLVIPILYEIILQ